MKLLYYVIMTSIIACAAANAEICAAEIRGTVLDGETHTPLVGASLRIQGSTTGAITDIDGRFMLATPSPGKYFIDVMYVGYKSALRKVTIEDTSDEALTIDVITADEIDDVNASTITNVLREVP